MSQDGGGGNGNGGESGVVTQITAKVDNASQYSNVVKVKLVAAESNGCEVLAEAEIKNGGFTLQLPEIVPERFLFPMGEFFSLMFGDELTYSDNNAKVLFHGFNYHFFATNSAGRQISVLLIRPPKDNSTKSYIYADRDVNASGSYDIDNFPIVLSLDLKRGWNVYYTITTLSPPKIEYRTSPAIGGNWKWFIHGGVIDSVSDCL